MSVRHLFHTPPGTDDIEAVAQATLATLPSEIRARLVDVVFRVEEFPDEDVMIELGLETPFDLLGLYQGVAITEKSIVDVVSEPDVVILYRRAILDYWCETGESLEDVIRHVLIHEVGHHMGFSDEDMERIETAH